MIFLALGSFSLMILVALENFSSASMEHSESLHACHVLGWSSCFCNFMIKMQLFKKYIIVSVFEETRRVLPVVQLCTLYRVSFSIKLISSFQEDMQA